MSNRRQKLKRDSLADLLHYILARRPDEFGLAPDAEGFVPYKTLIQALNEDPESGHVRRGQLREILMGEQRGLFEDAGDRIRAVERSWPVALAEPSALPPAILYLPVRRKAHGPVLENGLQAPDGKELILTADREMALRIGRRRDSKPVLLEVGAEAGVRKGLRLRSFGVLFLTPAVPADTIVGPPVPKRVQDAQKRNKEAKPAPEGLPLQPMAGGFLLDSAQDPDPLRRAKGKKRKGWKEDARTLRKIRGH